MTVLNICADHELFDLVQESVVFIGGDGRITAWNAASERLYGVSKANAIGVQIDQLLGSVGGPSSVEREWEGEVTRGTTHGKKVVVSIRRRVRRQPQIDAMEIIETGVDVTECRRVEELLSRSEHRYHNVFQAMSVSFWELDFTPVGSMVRKLLRSGVVDLSAYFASHPDFVREMIRSTRVIDLNDQSVRLFGRGDKQEMLNSLEPYWPDESIHVYAESVVAAVGKSAHYATETRLTSIDGREIDVWFTACFPPEMLERGKLLIGIIDISKDKSSRDELLESEQRYRSLFHFLPVALVQLDRRELVEYLDELKTQGVTDLLAFFDTTPGSFERATEAIRVVEVNRRTVELLGAKAETELIGSMGPLWQDAGWTIKQSMQARFNGERRFEAESKVRTRDGRILDVLYVAYFPDDDALGLACFVNITDRVKAQSALAQLQAEFAHAARVSMLGELTASIAHEVNQPLGAILTNGEATLRWLRRPEIKLDEIRSLATRSIADARRASDIIRRIREMAVRTEPEQSPIALNSVIEEALSFIRPELRRYRIEAKFELDPVLPIVRADRVQLQQVFVNLAVNAAHAMADAPTRLLTVRTVRLGETSLCAEIDDTGVGIPDNHLEQLFGSFFTTKKGGMGIGLAICRSIVEAHGGHIQAINLPDGGARFRVVLPMVC